MEGEIIMENVKILTQNLISLFSYSGGWILFIVGVICCVVGIVFTLLTLNEKFSIPIFVGIGLLVLTLFISIDQRGKYCKIYEIVPLEDKLEIDISKYEILEYKDNGIIKIRDKALYDSKGNEIKEDK